MKAAIFRSYGDKNSIVLEEVDKSVPESHEILIRVKATTVTAVDAIFRSGDKLFPRMATGLLKPKIQTLGTELSGVVEMVGDKVTGFTVGDAVIADSGTHYGAHAEYVLVSDKDAVVHKPETLSFNEAAAMSYGALTALAFLRDHGKVEKGDAVLVIGASGSVGSYAVQLANYFGAKVTGVCSTNNVKLVKSLGANSVIDYKKESLKDNRQQFDIVFDTVGKYSFGETKHLLKNEGVYLTTVLSLRSVFDMVRTRWNKKKSILALTGLRENEEKKKDLKFAAELFRQKNLRAVIDKTYTLDDIMDAFDYVEKGHKVGNVVITVEEL